MRVEELCSLELRYVGGFHLARPYRGEAGLGWGVGDGIVRGARLAGAARWSNQPSRRGDGAMLPNARGVIATDDGAEVFFDLTGRTIWVERDGKELGRQLLLVLFESDDDRYAWLNNCVCMGEGVIDTVSLIARIAVSTCITDL